jgi:hypothetical protein
MHDAIFKPVPDCEHPKVDSLRRNPDRTHSIRDTHGLPWNGLKGTHIPIANDTGGELITSWGVGGDADDVHSSDQRGWIRQSRGMR